MILEGDTELLERLAELKDLLNAVMTDDMEAMGFLRASSSLAAAVRVRTPSSAVARLLAS